jgi:hypothetical protein
MSAADGRQAVALRAASYARHAPGCRPCQGFRLFTGPGSYTHGHGNLITTTTASEPRKGSVAFVDQLFEGVFSISAV